MSNNIRIDYLNQTEAIIDTGNVAATFKIAEQPRDFNNFTGNTDDLDWNRFDNLFGDYRILNFGNNNDLPNIIRETVQKNYIAPGLLKRKTELLWGSGPKLYKEVIKDNKVIKEWVEDNEIQKWMDNWDADGYLLKSCIDYQHVNGVFTRFELNKGYRINKPFINKLHHIPSSKGRLARKRNIEELEPTHMVVTDWTFSTANSIERAKIYPLFEFANPFKSPNSIHYSNMYTFCTDYYSVPDIYGSLEWLNRSTAVPLIFKALSKNSINLKYHFISPQQFWVRKRNEMMENCTLRNKPFKETDFLNFQKDYIAKIAEVLSSDENAGKFLHTTKEFTVDGTNLIEHGWEIKVVDQNIKDFVESQIKISERADRAVASGISLQTQLGNITEGGESKSGSSQIYALINYLNTSVDIQEMIICKSINYAIKANWPNKNLKIGFHHEVPETQSQTNPEDRSRNNTQS